jgi:hypothetical protein
MELTSGTVDLRGRPDATPLGRHRQRAPAGRLGLTCARGGRYRWRMPILALKLLLAPVLIVTASLATRRWGPRVGGWLVSLPLTSGPILVILALEHGTAFSATAALGSLSGMAANAAFGVTYAYGGRRGPIAGMLLASAAFLAAGAALQPILGVQAWLVAVVVLASISLGLLLLPPRTAARGAVRHPRWDIPARIVVATTLVFALTSLAPALGPEVSGLLATYPVYASVMTTFTHHVAGLPAATELVRGHLTGIYGTVAFFVVLILLLVPAGLGPAILTAIIVALGTQAVAFRNAPGRRSRPAARPDARTP